MVSINPETREVFTAYYKPKLLLILLVYLLTPARNQHLELPESILNSTKNDLNIRDRNTVFEPKRIIKIEGRERDGVPHTIAQSSALLNDDNSGISTRSSPVNHNNNNDKPTSMSKGSNTLEEEERLASILLDVPSATPRAYLNTLTRIPSSSSNRNKDTIISDSFSFNPITTTLAEFLPCTSSSTSPTPSTTEQEELNTNSSTNEEDCPIDYRGRPLCPNTTRQPLSIRKRSSELSSELADAVSEFGLFVILTGNLLFQSLFQIEISPFFLFLFLLHLLNFLQLSSLIMEDTILRTSLSNPLPFDFPRAKTFGKRMTRLRFRWAQTWERFSWEIVGISLGLFIVGVIGIECWRGDKMGMWEDVPFAWVLSRVVLSEEAKEEVKVIGPMRELIALEIIATLSSLLQPIKHLLPTTIIPTSITSPSWLYASPPVIAQSSSFFPPIAPTRSTNSHLNNLHRRTSPRSSTVLNSSSRTPSPPPSHSHEKIALSSVPGTANGSNNNNNDQSTEIPISLETIWLLSLFSETLSSLITALQYLTLILVLPTYSPLTIAPHIIFHCVRSRITQIKKNKDIILKSVECLKTVFRVFPEGSHDREAQEEDKDWMCTICFEGTLSLAEEMVNGAGMGTNKGKSGVGSKCRLPCGHKFHPGCLIPWFRVQSFCPVCHASVVTPLPVTPPTPPSPNINEGDIFPGNVRRRVVVA